MTKTAKQEPQPQDQVIPLEQPPGPLRRLFSRGGSEARQRGQRSPLETIGARAQQASLWAVILLAIQVGLNLYGIPTPITFHFGETNNHTSSDTRTPAANVNTSAQPSPLEYDTEEGPASVVLERKPPGPPGPDFGKDWPAAKPAEEPPSMKMRDQLKLLREKLKLR